MNPTARQYKAVLFDLDGVLVDMREAHYEALNLALSAFGTKIEEHEHQTVFNGLPSRKKLTLLAKEKRIFETDIETINSMKQAFTKELVPRICLPRNEQVRMMEKLKEAGLRIGCCTNSMQEMAEDMLKTAGLFSYMEIIIGNDAVKNPKPNPEMYLSAMEQLGVTPEETLIVEDSPYGLEAAQASGATVYRVNGVADVNIGLFKEIL